MSENEKARSRVAAREQAMKSAAITAIGDSTPIDGNIQGFITAYLPHGEENAVPSKTLLSELGLSCERFLRRQVERERIDGSLILSNGNGYYLPSDEPNVAAAEISGFINRQNSRLRTNRLTLKAAQNALKAIEKAINGQQTIFGDEQT